MNRFFSKSALSKIALSLATVAFMALPAWAYSPQGLYDEVWKLVNSRFVDETTNGQSWEIWRHRYDAHLQTSEDAYVAIETMLGSLNDRYTRFLDPEEFSEEGQSIKATLFGIGIQIGLHNNKLVVIAPIEDTPADRAGLRASDEILEINGKNTTGMSVKDAASLIRGEQKTYVKLLVHRPEGNMTKLYTVMRDKIDLKSVNLKNPFSVPVPDTIGYIRLSSFLSKNAAFEIKNALKTYQSKAGLVLDLRSNPGGLLANAITMADFLIDSGAIVSTVDRDGYKETRRATPRVLSDQPLVVLIDGGSASASEILAGALQDHQRAVLVGERSFGKGLVQEINQLPGGAGINITTQRYLTPNDRDINAKGIEPDFTVKLTDEDIKAKKDPQLLKAFDVLKQLIAGQSVKAVLAQKAL